MHQRRQRQIHRRWFLRNAFDVGIEIGRRRLAEPRIAARTRHAPQIVVAPHHALRHARRAAGVQEQHVVRRPANAERRAIAASRRAPRRRYFRPQPCCPSATSIHCSHLRQLAANLAHVRCKLVRVDHDGCVGVVEQVDQLVVDVAVVDVHVREACLEPSRDRLAVLGTVAHVEGDLVAGARTACEQRARKIVGATRKVAPVNARIAVHERQPIVRCDPIHRVENVTVVPRKAHRYSAPANSMTRYGEKKSSQFTGARGVGALPIAPNVPERLKVDRARESAIPVDACRSAR